MSRKDALKIRAKIHEDFHLWFTIRRKPNKGDYFLFSIILRFPDGFRDFISDSGFSCYHFSDCETYIE